MFRKIIATLSAGVVLSAVATVPAAHAEISAKPSKITSINGCPGMSGHRGAPRLAPENTIAAYQAAADNSADAIEVDMRFNKSDFMFSLHDTTVDRTTNGTGLLSNLWFGEAQALSAADYTSEFGMNWKTSSFGGFKADGTPKTRIPYAYEILTVAKANNLKIVLDLKDNITQDQMDFWMSYVDRPEFQYRSKLIWQVGTPSMINTLKNTWGYDDMPYYLFQYRPSVDAVWSKAYLNRIGADGVAVPPMNIDNETVAYWHSFGMKVITWTSDIELGYDNPATWSRLATADVDYITTNDAAWYAAWCTAGMANVSRPAVAIAGK